MKITRNLFAVKGRILRGRKARLSVRSMSGESGIITGFHDFRVMNERDCFAQNVGLSEKISSLNVFRSGILRISGEPALKRRKNGEKTA